MVDSPKHVKKLTLEQLHHLAEEIRQELINGLAKNGGHLGCTIFFCTWNYGRSTAGYQRYYWQFLFLDLYSNSEYDHCGG